MGQRLNIEIVKNDKTIANCYYHWSAYTLSSLVKALEVIENYDNLLKQNLPDEVLVVKMFEGSKSFDFFYRWNKWSWINRRFIRIHEQQVS